MVASMEQPAHPPRDCVAVPGARGAVERLEPDDYLRLHHAIRAPMQWDERLRMTAEALAALLADATLHFSLDQVLAKLWQRRPR
jgi:hypothetical protein